MVKRIKGRFITLEKALIKLNEGILTPRAKVDVRRELGATPMIQEKLFKLQKDLKTGILPEDLFKEFKNDVVKICDTVIKEK